MDGQLFLTDNISMLMDLSTLEVHWYRCQILIKDKKNLPQIVVNITIAVTHNSFDQRANGVMTNVAALQTCV